MATNFEFKFSFRGVSAREMSHLNKLLKENPEESIEQFADLLAKTVKEAPVNGPVENPDTWLDLPFWTDDPDELCFQTCVDFLNEAMGKASGSTKKR